MKQTKAIPKEVREEILKWPDSFYDRGEKAGREKRKEKEKSITAIWLATDLTQEELLHLKK